jgi:hypothetical protein
MHDARRPSQSAYLKIAHGAADAPAPDEAADASAEGSETPAYSARCGSLGAVCTRALVFILSTSLAPGSAGARIAWRAGVSRTAPLVYVRSVRVSQTWMPEAGIEPATFGL